MTKAETEWDPDRIRELADKYHDAADKALEAGEKEAAGKYRKMARELDQTAGTRVEASVTVIDSSKTV